VVEDNPVIALMVLCWLALCSAAFIEIFAQLIDRRNRKQ
jgi:hypothetical protein